MNLHRKLLSVLMFLLISQFCYSQAKPEAALVDDFGRVCSGLFQRNYDYFLIDLHADPQSTGYILFTGEIANEGTNLGFIRYMTNYLRFRGFDEKRIIVLRSENREEMRFQFWSVPENADPPQVEENFIQSQISEVFRFQRSYAEFEELSDSGEQFRDSYYVEGCDFPPALQEFASALLNDTNLNGYLVTSGKRKQAQKVEDFAIKELTNEYKIPRSRIKAIYRGKSDYPMIELWFVPNDKKFTLR